jgi:hypothetical protein
MAGVGIPMQITAVDSYNNLFFVDDVFPQHIVDAVLSTDWLNLPWMPQEGQESWARRRIDNSALSWMPQWEEHFKKIMPQIEFGLGKKLCDYRHTAWWLDEPGFTCDMHTDGEMPGAMQLTWVGAVENLGTSFYHYNNTNSLRHKFIAKPNSGYIMINTLDATGARHLQWHAMTTPVPANTFRLCSYSWLTEKI